MRAARSEPRDGPARSAGAIIAPALECWSPRVVRPVWGSILKRLIWVLVLLVGAAGCERRNTNCEWPTEPSRPLDVRNGVDERHLVQDVIVADRYGDVRWPPGKERRQRRDEECLSVLFSEIASRHNVPLDVVYRARERIGEKGLNLVVNIPIVGFAILLSVLMAERVRQRFSADDEQLAVVVAAAFVSVLVGGLTAGLGVLWETAVEIARVGNAHLSYRGERLQWGSQQGWMLFLFGVGIAWFAILGRYFTGRHRSVPSGRYAV
jgi:hypothetical protein